MKSIIFDSSTIISMSMNGLFNELKELRRIFDGKFIITKEVKSEIIDRPLTIKKFELEALNLQSLLDEKILEMPNSLKIDEKELLRDTYKIIDIANSTFDAKGKKIHLIDIGEASCLALSKILSEKKIKNVIAIDERTTRVLCERPENLKELLEKKLHTKITSKKENYGFFSGFKFIRSAELMYFAYKKGVIHLKNGHVLDALLYALKYKGCSISEEEIEEIKKVG